MSEIFNYIQCTHLVLNADIFQIIRFHCDGFKLIPMRFQFMRFRVGVKIMVRLKKFDYSMTEK